ncbi:hypothetical protein ACSDZ4_000192 [Escherichia coli]|uniref:hypothetical protein n=1 Tax=Escherichia coli TaxID=562 RepID=UPI001FCEA5A4|nr:hypothetical protein [Escherichia coli]
MSKINYQALLLQALASKEGEKVNRTIIVTTVISVPTNAPHQDIDDFVESKFGQDKDLKQDSLCYGDATEIISHHWEYGPHYMN